MVSTHPTLQRTVHRRIVAVSLCAALSACGGSSVNGTPAEDPTIQNPTCSQGQGKSRVLEILEADYLWNDEALQKEKYAQVVLAEYPDDQSLLEDLRWKPEQYDRGFTYITSPAAEERQNAGQTLSYGFSLVRLSDPAMVMVRETIEGGPVHSAGVRRGWELVSIDDRPLSTFESAADLRAALGYPAIREGTTRSMTFRDQGGDTRGPFRITVEEFSVNPVPEVRILSDRSQPVGYVRLRSFVPPAIAGFESAIKRFQEADISKIVIDLRYNGGGSLAVAQAIGGMIAGPSLRDRIMYRIRFNDENRQNDSIGRFVASYQNNSLPEGTFTDIAFLTSEQTASASELLLHSLKPYGDEISTIAIGSPSYGKPVGQIAQDYCEGEKRLRTVAFAVENADREGDYFAGLPVDCTARDGWEYALGDPREDSLQTALFALESGSCPANPSTTSARLRSSPASPDYLSISKRFDWIL